MSYQAIARKWRPATFEEMAGQSHVTRTLRNALRLKRIHHAFLFTGARGVGKTTAARTLARCLNCVDGPTPVPCGVCPSCLEVPLGNSSDVTEIDGASNNSVDNVRELRESVRYLPARDRYRIYIIDEVHMLTIGAFNALLKTLEEPPPHVVFIFATTEPQKIPDTILSRVQRFDFKRIPESVVVGRLATICEAEGVKVPEAGLRLIARAGEGSMRDAQSLLDQVIAFGGQDLTLAQVAETLGMVDRELLYGFLEGLISGEPDRCLDIIATVYDYGYELSQFTAEMLELLRNAALVVLSPRARKHVDVAEEELERLARVCEGVNGETFARLFGALISVHDEVSRSSRPRLVLEMAVARLATVRNVQPVDHLLSRLEDLERRLRAGGARPRSGPGGAARTLGPPSPLRASLRDEEDAPTERYADAEGPPAESPRPSARFEPRPPTRVDARPPVAPEPTPARPEARSPVAPAEPAPARPPEPRGAPVEDARSGNWGSFAGLPAGASRPPPKVEAPKVEAPRARATPEDEPDEPSLFAPRPSPRPPAAAAPGPHDDEPSLFGRRPPPPPPPKVEAAPPPAPVITPPPESATAEQRFKALREHLKAIQNQTTFAENTVLDGFESGELRLAAPPAFLERVRQALAEIQPIAAVFFPGLGHVTVRAAGDGDGLTAQQARKERHQRHREQVDREMRADPLILQVVDLFDAKIAQVEPDSYPEEE